MQLQPIICVCPNSNISKFLDELFKEEPVALWCDVIPIENEDFTKNYPGHALLSIVTYDTMTEDIYTKAKCFKGNDHPITIYEPKNFKVSNNYEEIMLNLAQQIT